MARILVGLGITKIRLTGGEPLLRKGIVEFVRDLAKLRTFEGKKPEIALTTNGHLLAEIAQPLKDAGLDRVTVSMDAVDPERFARITRVPNGYESVLAGVRAARQAGLDPVKINCVLLRGFNEDQIIPFGMFAREERVVVRFIEFMPLEEDRVWTPEIVVRLDEIVSRMSEYLPLEEIAHERSETARRYRFSDGVGEIGIIAPVSHPFCGHCSRIRITSDGKLRTCLFSVWDHDLHELMRRGATDEKLSRVYCEGGGEERRAAPHRGAGICAGVADDGAYRRVGQSAVVSRWSLVVKSTMQSSVRKGKAASLPQRLNRVPTPHGIAKVYVSRTRRT